MSTIDILIKNNTYQLSCDDGQEEVLRSLVATLNIKISKLSTKYPRATDNLLLVMAALMAEDEISSLKKGNFSHNYSNSIDLDLEISKTIDSLSEYIEVIVNKYK